MKNLIPYYFSIAFILTACLELKAQEAIKQNVTGYVISKQNNETLIGAHVSLHTPNETIQTVTDMNGAFEFIGISPGRISLSCKYLGFEDYRSASIILNSARPLQIDILLEASAFAMDSITVVAKLRDDETLNGLAVLSGRSFSAEETERYPGSIADPSRMAVTYAGVQSSNDLDNDLIIRGNSALGLQWQLEGIPILNPNHFARIGSSGGGISMLSVNMLENSDFLFGSMPSEYGNCLAGAFDMKFRKGSAKAREYSLRAGIIGLDFMTEGPIKKDKSSYLINYRYSTLDLLNKAGLHLVGDNTDNRFSDLAMNFSFASDDKSTQLNVWALLGTSLEAHSIKEDTTGIKDFDDSIYTDFSTRAAMVGINMKKVLNDKSFLQMSSALMMDHIQHDKSFTESFDEPLLRNENYNQTMLNISAKYSRQWAPHVFTKFGAYLSLMSHDMFFEKLDRSSNERQTFINSKYSFAENYIAQSFGELKLDLSPKMELIAGVNMLYYAMNTDFSFNPRLALVYHVDPRSKIMGSLSRHSQIIPVGSQVDDPNKSSLGLMHAQHYTLAYARSIGSNLSLNIEAYYQMLINIPVSVDILENYWLYQSPTGYSEYDLQSTDKGKNIGIDISLESFFKNGWFYLVSASLFDAKYSLDGSEYYDARYDGGYSSSLMAGKEINFSKSNSTLLIGFRNLVFGGQRYFPSNDLITQNIQEFYDNREAGLTEQNRTYWRSDMRISYRKNKKSYAWHLSLDIQNLLNRENTRGEIWDLNANSYAFRPQAGFIPVINFQIDF